MRGNRVTVLLSLGYIALLAGCSLWLGGQERAAPDDQAGGAASGILEAQSMSGATMWPLLHQGDIWLLPGQGDDPVRMSGSGRAWSPSVSPDGGSLVYVVAPAAEEAPAELWALALATAKATLTATPGAERWYVVQRGDTLSSIAIQYGTTWQSIAQANGLNAWSVIYPGQRLRIP